MGDSNFQHFFDVLEEVEAANPKEQEKQALETSPEKWSTLSAIENSEKMVPIWDIKTVTSNCKARKYSLRRPGFIYRTKDFTRASYLESNLWEFTTCGQRILKSPSFKYRKRRKSNISPYSTKILESFGQLTLIAKSTTPPLVACPVKALQAKPGEKESEPSKILFLPLKKSLDSTSNVTHSISKKKRAKLVIRPAKMGCTSAKKPVKSPTNISNSKPAESSSFGWRGTSETSSFSHISAKIEPLVVRKYASSSFDDFRDSTNSGNNRKALSNAIAAFNDIKEHSDTDDEKSGPCSESPKRLIPGIERSCSFQARMCEQDMSVDEMSIHMEDILFLPQKMSTMAEMMYT